MLMKWTTALILRAFKTCSSSRLARQTGTGRILPQTLVDQWGHKYFYDYPGKHIANGYDLFSAGEDGKPGTDDDIVNWSK